MNRAVSVDGFIAGPDDAMGWIFEHLTNAEFPEVRAATGAMVAARCLQAGYVDEILGYVIPVLLGDGVRFSARASAGSTSSRSRRAGQER